VRKNKERNGQKTSVKRKLSDIHLNKRNLKAVTMCKVNKQRQERKKEPFLSNKM